MTVMFDRLLIANRGEIACRITETAQRLGIHVIAVYSTADQNSRHVRMADEAHWIGPASPTESYLNQEVILKVAQDTQAQAIHPGYGFLAENADFAEKVVTAGLAFIGPTAQTIRQMGSKSKAKAMMECAEVPILPGYHGDDQTDAGLLKEAESIGFPLMIKAQAGGGGKGMRIVKTPETWAEGLAAARREAMNAFGDDAVILERYLDKPHHIEAQILGDHHGQVVHLYERDCSSQRRHQKIIEEAPATHLPQETRDALLNAAVKAGKAVNYQGAGTVEFLVDNDQTHFYFLEMNTRLQVEHPVTEAITGWDLVEWQLKIALGDALPSQSEVPKANGHAIEARIYAENPDQQFLPATGRVQQLHWPSQSRVDTGIDPGDTVSVHYDPMVAKLIVWADSRARALSAMRQALDECFIDGLTSNLGFLQSLVTSQDFEDHRIDTGYLDRALSAIYQPQNAQDEQTAHALDCAVAWWVWHQQHTLDHDHRASPWSQCDGWRMGMASTPITLSVKHPDQGPIDQIKVWREDNQVWIGHDLHQRRTVCLEPPHPVTQSEGRLCHRFQCITDSQNSSWVVIHQNLQGQVDICVDHRRYRFWIQPRYEGGDARDDSDALIKAPMPGKIIGLHVKQGQQVAEQDPLLVMEAMKMELSLVAPISGVIANIHVTEGARVDAQTLMIEIEPADRPQDEPNDT